MVLLKRKPEAEAGGLKITSFFVPLAKAPKKQAASKAAAAGQPPAEQPAPPAAAAAAAEQPAAAPTAAGPGVGAQPRQPADFQRFALSRGGAPPGTTGTQRQPGSADGAARSSAAGAVPGAAASKQQLCADAAAEAKARQQSPQRPEQQQPQQQEGPAGPLAAATGSPIGASCSPALPASAYAAAGPAAGQQAVACTVHAGGCEAAAGSSGAACSSGEGAGVAAAASGARSPDAAVAGPPMSPGEQQVGSSAGLEVAGGREVGASTGSESNAESERDGREDGPTDYERAREERIRRNMEVMRSMGLGAPAVSPKRALKKKPAARRKSTPAPAPQAERKYPLRSRRASAAAGLTGAEGAEDAAIAAALQEEEEPPLVFDDSSVLRYVCGVAAPSDGQQGMATGSGRSSSADERCDAPEGAQITGFAHLPGTLTDSALARAYSVDWRPGLVVAGGKDGQVSIFGSREVEGGGLPADAEAPPLLSARLHKGWIADVQFVRGAQHAQQGSAAPAAAESGGGGLGSSLLLLTAGNDGTLCLWDAARSAAQGRSVQPQQLARCTDLHSGGIFSMHEAAGSVITASKDCTVAVSTLGEGCSGTLRLLRRYEELHEGVVKCARWRDAGSTFASCGNDRMVCVVDTRQSGTGPSLALPEAHATAINCLRWHPTAEHLLLSASHDPHILLHDLRQLAQPLFTFTGHSLQSRLSAIYQPAFVWGGAGVATGGEKSGCLSLYCTATGSTLSRGEVDFTIGATFCGAGREDPLVCTAARAVHVLTPTWRPQAAGEYARSWPVDGGMAAEY